MTAQKKMTVRFHRDLHGWAMECPRCGVMSLRDDWKGAFFIARLHWANHARFPHEH